MTLSKKLRPRSRRMSLSQQYSMEALENRQLMSTVTVSPEADAYVESGTSTTNYGTATTLLAKHVTSNPYQRRIFTQFGLPDLLNVTSAKIRMYGSLAVGTNAMTVGVYSVSSVTWGESTINWSNQPSTGGSSLDTESIPNTTDAWFEWDVTSYVTSQLAGGADSVAFALKSTNDTAERAEFNSREASTFKPHLVIEGVERKIVTLDNKVFDTSTSTWVTSPGVTNVGFVNNSTSTDMYQLDEFNDANTGKGSRHVTFAPTLATGGEYDVYGYWSTSAGRSTSVPITVTHVGGSSTVNVNQQSTGGAWYKIGTYEFSSGNAGTVKISNTGTTGWVVADAVRFVAVDLAPENVRLSSATPTQVIINWDDQSVSETGFAVERRPTGSGSYTQIGTTAANVITYTDNTASAGTTYDYRVRATGSFTNTGASYSPAAAISSAATGRRLVAYQGASQWYASGASSHVIHVYGPYAENGSFYTITLPVFDTGLGTLVSNKQNYEVSGTAMLGFGWTWRPGATPSDHISWMYDVQAHPGWNASDYKEVQFSPTVYNPVTPSLVAQHQVILTDSETVLSPGVPTVQAYSLFQDFGSWPTSGDEIAVSYQFSVKAKMNVVYEYTP